jgi:hypothetical protein
MRTRSLILIAIILLTSYSYVLPRWADWNQNSRLDLVRALSEQHDVVIDDYVNNTGDYALYQGHAYSDKAPGPAFLALPAALMVQPMLDLPASQRLLERLSDSGKLSATLNPEGSGINTDKLRSFVLLLVSALFASALPTALGALALYALLRRHAAGSAPAMLVTLAYGLATPLAAYGGNFYSHALVASLLIGAWLITDLEYAPARVALVGLLLGWAVISEYPAALPAAIIGLAAVWRWRRPSALFWLTLGGLPPVLLMAIYDWRAFGTPLPIGYEHSALWQQQHQTGFLSITYPHAAALWGLLFGLYRGLFARAPWLLLALPGYVIWWRSGRARAHWWVALLAPLSMLLFYGSSAMWPGGFAAGPRYLVLISPFLACACAPAAIVIWRRLAGRIALFTLIAGSLVATWSEAVARQSFPPDEIANPWLGYTWPAWRDADIARNIGTFLGLRGGASLLPLALLIIVAGAYLLRRPTHAAATSSPPAHITEGQTVAPIQH